MVQYNTVNVKLSNLNFFILKPNNLKFKKKKKKKKKKWNQSNFKSCMKFG